MTNRANANDEISTATFRPLSSQRRSSTYIAKVKKKSTIQWDEANLENNNNVYQHSNSLES